MNIACKNGIILDDFKYDELGNFLLESIATLTRESDGYGLRWSHAFSIVYGYYNATDYANVSWPIERGFAASETTDSTDTIWKNLRTAYNNGDNLVVEFTAKA